MLRRSRPEPPDTAPHRRTAPRAEGRHPHPRRPREAQGRDRAPLHGEAEGGRRAHQGGARVRGHLRELGVRRRQERAGHARVAHRLARGQAALRVRDRLLRARQRRRPRGVARQRQGRVLGQVAEVHDRRLDRGEPGREQALQRVPRGQGPRRPQAQRRGQRPAAQRQGPQAQDHQDRSRVVADEQPSELLAVRRRKLEALREEGIEPFPHAFPGVRSIAEVKAPHEDLPAGEETDDRVRVAGRLAARRGQGKAAFLDLVDRSGRLQLHARVDVLGPEAFDRLLSFDLGDLIGADGTVFRSRRGELSLRLEAYELLAKSLRPPPEKHHGLTDVETRFRHRELDLVANEEARELFMLRARVVSSIRRTLDDEGFIEVETPILQPLYGGALARPFTTHFNALDRDMYLRIATELYLKRLIVGGLERVYEIGKNFRNEGLSFKHNPEFTVLEWYAAYEDYHDAASRLEQLVSTVARTVGYEGDIDFSPPWQRITLRDAIRNKSGIDVLEHRDAASLAAAIGDRLPTEDRAWPELVDDLLSKFVEPDLHEPTFILDYPVELSPLAKTHRSEDGLVERFEAFAGGMEIANAFSELNDPADQRARFEAQTRLADAGSDETMPYDEVYVEALEQGMPPTAGLGLGIDRLVMLLGGRRSIREVVLFPAMRD